MDNSDFVKSINFGFFISFILAYVSGALLHLIEDSATVTGIQLNYPFSNLILRGELITRPDSAEKSDKFTSFLGIVTVALFFATGLGYIPYPDWLITIVSVMFLIICWSVFLLLIAKVKFERGELRTYNNVT